jgi:hypothetical protein
MTTVLLLDIDGVLVKPGGYRTAVRAAVNYFVNLMGLPDFEIPEEKIAWLESHGITSEWDMVPLLIATLWEDVLSRHPLPNLPSDVSLAAIQIGKYLNGYESFEWHIPDFELVPGQCPADTALKSGLFSSIPKDLRTNLLHGSRDVHFSQTLRTFQQFTLGSEVFTQTYNLPADFVTESFLYKYDRSKIDNAIREKLRQTGVHLTAFTARPSAPPREVQAPALGYSPEAEIALDLVGLTDIPMISFGKLQYLGKQRGYDPEIFLKPSPVQALAAIAAALTGNEWSSLQAACDWYETGQLTGFLAELPQSFEVSVVEDTLGGVRSLWAAGEILKKTGFDVTVRAYGLTSGSAIKSAAFEGAGVPYFKNWETLIDVFNQ